MKIICTKEEFAKLVIACDAAQCRGCALAPCCEAEEISQLCEIQNADPLTEEYTCTVEETAQPDCTEEIGRLFLKGIFDNLTEALNKNLEEDF